MARMLPKNRGVFLQMEDEIASICACLGAAWRSQGLHGHIRPRLHLETGRNRLGCGDGHADRRHRRYAGGAGNGPAHFFGAQDVMQARYGSHGDYEIIALTPSSVQEAFDLTVRPLIWPRPTAIRSSSCRMKSSGIPAKKSHSQPCRGQHRAGSRSVSRKIMFPSARDPQGFWKGCPPLIRGTESL